LASSVTSASGSIVQLSATASTIACTVCGRISEGVPPPKKIERTVRRGANCARCRISVRNAAT
jgi:hypothetical protein